MAQIIRRAKPHAAFDVPVLILIAPPPLLAAEHLAVLIQSALAFSAHYISMVVLTQSPALTRALAANAKNNQ
jgi:hypothetical protein